MGYRVIIKRRAQKEIAKLDAKAQKLIVCWIRDKLQGCDDPKAIGDGRKLESVEDGWRWRVGAWRILAVIKEQEVVIEVFRVGHRRNIYRRL